MDTKQTPADATAKPRILVIDDDPVLKRVIAMGLGKSGYEVTTVGNGEEAMAVLKSSVFDVIMVDMMMPFMDGLRFLSWLRGTAGIQTPVLVQTSLARQKIEDDVRAAGAQDLIIKPARLPELLEKIRKLVGR
jgi:CheY-like chemotaxis protein